MQENNKTFLKKRKKIPSAAGLKKQGGNRGKRPVNFNKILAEAKAALYKKTKMRYSYTVNHGIKSVPNFLRWR